jgi:hypothetical protein
MKKMLDDVALPVTLGQNANGKVEFTDAALMLTSGLKYTQVGHLRVTPATGASTTTVQGDAGTYTFANGTVTLMSTAGNGADVATVAGTKMTILFQGTRALESQSWSRLFGEQRSL